MYEDLRSNRSPHAELAYKELHSRLDRMGDTILEAGIGTGFEWGPKRRLHRHVRSASGLLRGEDNTKRPWEQQTRPALGEYPTVHIITAGTADTEPQYQEAANATAMLIHILLQAVGFQEYSVLVNRRPVHKDSRYTRATFDGFPSKFACK